MKTWMKKSLLPLLSAMALLLAGCGQDVQTVHEAFVTQVEEAQLEEVSSIETQDTDELVAEIRDEAQLEESDISTTQEETTLPNEAEEVDSQAEVESDIIEDAGYLVDEDAYYYDVENVILYLDAYGHLPNNYISKKEAQSLGWSGGSVEDYKEGGAIGGSHFGNYEGLLPDGPSYTECDIDTQGKSSRGAKRLIFSDDGHYYYTEDHYESFTEMVIVDGSVEEK